MSLIVSDVSARRLSRVDVLWLLASLTTFAVFATYFALYLVPWDAEYGYLVFGGEALKGQVRLFQNEIVGQRLPLPFYVIGITQVLAGPSLLAGRLLSVALGVGVLAFAFRLGTLLGGKEVGFLALLFLMTHGGIVGYYAAASHFALTALIIVGGIWALAEFPGPRGRLLCMASFSLLSLSRPNLATFVPAILVYLVATAPSRIERVVLVLLALGPPVVFLLSSEEHLKILAYLPGVSRVVEPLGYRSLFDLGASAMIGEGVWRSGVMWFVRRHAFWLAASALALGTFAAARGRSRADRRNPPLVVLCGVLAVYGLMSQIAVYRMYPKSVSAYVAAFAPLWALVLAYGTSLAIKPGVFRWPIRMASVSALVAIFTLSPTFARHSAMPHPLPVGTSVQLLDRAAREIASVTAPGARVFLIGASVVPYLAGLAPYHQQVMHEWTLVTSTDHYAISRSGLWGTREIDDWLGTDAPFALIDDDVLDALRRIAAYRPIVQRIEMLLERNFRLVATVRDFPFKPRIAVYRRITAGRER
jgi:hypothetical protein